MAMMAMKAAAPSTQISGENFHSDQSCGAIPPLGSMLYNHTVPPDGGGDTMFASMYAAYEALSPRMKAYLSGLSATHDGRRVFGPTAPVAVHPALTPATGGYTFSLSTVAAPMNTPGLLIFTLGNATDPSSAFSYSWVSWALPSSGSLSRTLGSSVA